MGVDGAKAVDGGFIEVEGGSRAEVGVDEPHDPAGWHWPLADLWGRS
jgi:hypothetical protein